jgi:hypothetical protein
MILEVEKVGSLLTYVSHIDSYHECFFYCTEVLCMQDHRHAHLAIKERQIANEYLAIHDRQIASMSYQTNYSKREYFVSHTWDI